MLRFVVVLVAALGVFTWIAYRVAVGVTQVWFERDLSLRSKLAVVAARDGLLERWRAGDRAGAEAMLSALAVQERVMGAAACDLQGRPFATSEVYPPEPQLGCGGYWQLPLVSTRVDEVSGANVDLASGAVHVSAIDLPAADGPFGTVLLVHDLSFVRGRRAQLRDLVLAGFAALAVGASVLAILMARRSWRDWTHQLRTAAAGGAARPEFAPLLQDVRALVRDLALEETAERGAGAWTPERLKHTLTHHLHGQRVVIAANREPYIHQRGPDGQVTVVRPASGLVTALEPVMRACSGVWVAHGGGSADRDTADASGRLAVPPDAPSYTLRRVWLSDQEERGYYYGLANEGLWPLCHMAHTRPQFRAADWQHYRTVNDRFAEAVCREADSDAPVVLVQDYHFALLPEYIRRRLPHATVLTFWHIPWPNAERIAMCPWHADVLTGLLGSSIVGFHTQLHCNNFMESVDRYLEARIDRERFAVVQAGRSTLVRPYPISIEWPNHWAANAPPVEECRRYVRQQLGVSADTAVGMGVDRLDYTKGVEERLLAVERLLQREPSLVGRFTFVQMAAPSRSAIPEYQALASRVTGVVDRINQHFAQPGWRPIVLLHQHHEPPAVFRFFRGADFCYVSSLHDGMNLVAKEFVAARDDEQGVLILSQFTGAARELPEALLVNPYDLEAASSAMAWALAMTPAEQRQRMKAMRSYLSHFNVYRWAGRMLLDAAALRRREQVLDRAFGRRQAAPPIAETASGAWRRGE
jgi:trehalose 6-phosphate synthase